MEQPSITLVRSCIRIVWAWADSSWHLWHLYLIRRWQKWIVLNHTELAMRRHRKLFCMFVGKIDPWWHHLANFLIISVIGRIFGFEYGLLSASVARRERGPAALVFFGMRIMESATWSIRLWDYPVLQLRCRGWTDKWIYNRLRHIGVLNLRILNFTLFLLATPVDLLFYYLHGLDDSCNV